MCFKMNKKLKTAVQKSGRLSDDSINLLKKCGINFGNGLGKLRSTVNNFPIEIFFLRDDDIPNYVEDAVADVGIVGENVLAEKNCRVKKDRKPRFWQMPTLSRYTENLFLQQSARFR